MFPAPNRVGAAPRRRHPALLGALVCVLLLLPALTAPAEAGKSQESIFQDDRLLLFSGSPTRESALTEMRALGADTIHSVVFWNRIAPAADTKTKPAGFDGADPADYPASSWDPYDGLVRGAAARGLGLLLSPAGGTPAWASDCKGSVAARRTCNPDPKEYGDFVTALARRYSGSYADENQGGGTLPRVTRWSIWNEPNLAGWLQPQLAKKSGSTLPSAPHRYRRLVYAATAAFKATGHGGDQVLLGETAPIGRRSGPAAKRSMPPADFYRELFCLDRKGRALKGRDAKLRSGCKKMKKLSVSGVAHHPYTSGAGRPPLSKPEAGDVTISTLARLREALSRGSARKRIRSSPPIFLTEFGFQTDPPDKFVGVSPARQAEYLNQSDYIAFRDARVRSVAQFELIDEENVATFNTGLRFNDGVAKPAYDAYRLPIWVVKNGTGSKVFGQLRPSGTGGTLEVQHRSNGGDFETVASPALNGQGYFLIKVSRKGGRWRLRLAPPGGGVFHSREAKPASP